MSITTAPAPAPTKDDYVEFCEQLEQLTGIDLLQYKRGQMERRLRAFFDRRGIDSLAAGIVHVRGEPARLEELLDRITINVSQLWRNPEQWRRIETDLIPELAATGAVRAWSAGSSYGAEAFTLATVCRIAAPRARVTITGTDIDKRMVARARTGVFTPDDARSAPGGQLRQGFDRVGEEWHAKPELKAITRFEVGDLLRTFPRINSFDLILCRNTVIYFDEPTRDALHERLAEALRPGGYMVVGSTERVAQPARLRLRMTHPFIYRKA